LALQLQLIIATAKEGRSNQQGKEARKNFEKPLFAAASPPEILPGSGDQANRIDRRFNTHNFNAKRSRQWDSKADRRQARKADWKNSDGFAVGRNSGDGYGVTVTGS
jgi:hypothetical protein